MIQWFESEYPQNAIVPEDPTLAFICYLLEDWADEWWWRPAMHYRWYYEEGARFASGHLAREVMGGLYLRYLLSEPCFEGVSAMVTPVATELAQRLSRV